MIAFHLYRVMIIGIVHAATGTFVEVGVFSQHVVPEKILHLEIYWISAKHQSFGRLWRKKCAVLVTGWVMHIWVSNLTIIGSDSGLLPGKCQAMHCLNQCWNIVHWTLGNKLQWNFNRNSYSFIQENAFQNIWKWGPFCLSLNVLMVITDALLPIGWWKYQKWWPPTRSWVPFLMAQVTAYYCGIHQTLRVVAMEIQQCIEPLIQRFNALMYCHCQYPQDVICTE